MKKALKVINECVFSKTDKVERLNKLDKLRKNLYSEIGMLHNININLCELIDDISVKKC